MESRKIEMVVVMFVYNGKACPEQRLGENHYDQCQGMESGKYYRLRRTLLQPKDTHMPGTRAVRAMENQGSGTTWVIISGLVPWRTEYANQVMDERTLDALEIFEDLASCGFFIHQFCIL
jgi:hypothetical protein